jgi:glutathione S-transferase
MKLYLTKLSHFSRKVRILLDLYSATYETIDIGNVAEAEKSLFASNPLMSVPVLEDSGLWMIESDHIAAYLVQKFDSADKYQILTNDVSTLNARAVLNGIMASEVKYILAKRTHVPVEQYAYFSKSLKVIEQGLDWLENNIKVFKSENLNYLQIHLVCVWDHLRYYDLLDTTRYPLVREIADQVSTNKIVLSSAPHVLRPKS